MTPVQTSSTATNTTIYMSWPEGKRHRGRVKVIDAIEADPEGVHPRRGHRWHEMLHYGQPGTGFVECHCGAIGVPYRLPHRIVADAARGALATLRERFRR